MWFMECILIVMFLTALTFFAGQPLLFLLSRQNKILTLENVCLTLLYGTLTISYLFSIGSYAGLPGKYIGPMILVVILVTTLILKNKLPRDIELKNIGKFLVIYFVVIIISLLPLFLYNAFFPFNDTMTYVSVSDYLYSHGFLKKHPNFVPFQPFESKIEFFRGTRSRMGSNFFLAALQSILGIKKSIFIFPAVQTWGLILNLASIVVAARWIVHLRSHSILVIISLAAITFNPLYYSVHSGFFNQLYGVAYFTITLAAFTRLIRHSNSQEYKRFVYISAVFTATLLLFYPELFPFAVLVIALSMWIPLIRQRQNKKRWFFALSLFAVISMAIANISVVGLVRFLMLQINAVVGWDMPFTSLEFVSTALGVMPIENSGLTLNLLAVSLLTLFIYSIYKLVTHNFVKYYTLLCALVIFAAAFIYFRFCMSNPWPPYSIGHHWNMFKIVGCVYPCATIAIGYSISLLRMQKLLSYLLIIIAIPVAILSHPVYFRPGVLLTFEYLKSHHPFEDLQRFVETIRQLHTNQPIEIAFLDDVQIFAYFLHPIPVVIQTFDAPYLKNPHYIILHREKVLSDTARLLPANVALIDSTMPYLKYLKDTYELERSDDKSFRWSMGHIKVGLHADKAQSFPMKLSVRFVKTPAKLTLRMSDTPILEYIIKNQEWTNLKFVVDLKQGDNILSLDSDIKPTRVRHDTRLLVFAISDLGIDMDSTRIVFFKNMYGSESLDNMRWRWSKGDAVIGVQSDKNQHVKIKFDVRFLTTPAKLMLRVADNDPKEIFINKKDWQPIEFNVSLQKGNNTLSLLTNVQPTKVGLDPRPLTFAISNFKIFSSY